MTEHPPSTIRTARRAFLAGTAGALLAGSAAARARPTPGLAITLDDFQIRDTPRMTGAARHAAILTNLRRRGVRAAGFPAGKFIDNPEGQAHLRAWSDAGHLIGNHSYSHAFYGGASPQAMMDDILRAEPLLSPYRGFRKLFRYPYLAEGKTAEGRDGLRQLLATNGYRIASVTIDTSDWYISSRLSDRLGADPDADVAPFRAYYLDHLWNRATYYDGLARRVLGHSIDHTILLHHNLLNGLFLGDALAMFRNRGWRLVDAAAVFDQPLLQRQPNTLPAGQSLIWALAKEVGAFEGELRFPGEDERYEKPAMDRLGL